MIFFANWFIFIDNNELNDKTFIIKSQIVTIKDGKKKTSVMVFNYMKEVIGKLSPFTINEQPAPAHAPTWARVLLRVLKVSILRVAVTMAILRVSWKAKDNHYLATGTNLFPGRRMGGFAKKMQKKIAECGVKIWSDVWYCHADMLIVDRCCRN
jgi:hypothetical protein